ncbi:hypothetical protein N6H18_10370 [Reichenbachiella agarivorans]|uniref:Lipoprotein n=1 Tax=Reichenbachiella agarivorans TaxID=2979464 RepID=A0ABY6CJQ9_9BACT|nr:hypothetical protein [Reichenbachiella agarivorans]UXP30756.1 hypothetical protein N6H18_10370 [Reichenbachiella agarivorans]
MNVLTKSRLLCAILLSAVFASCNVEDKLEDKIIGCDADDYDFTELSTKINETQKAYLDDPTPATCSAYVDAMYAYVDGVDDAWDCVPKPLRIGLESSLDAYDEIIKETEDDCDEL